jgi:ADP-ribosyl-[dinitrogen reductase] hydrolase
MQSNKVLDVFFGFSVGDALGVPVEFLDRKTITNSPVITMQGYGTHDQPAGTWSDDSSLAFCLAESLKNGYDLEEIASNFVKWYTQGFWTPHGKVFDVGIATSQALRKIELGTSALLSGGTRDQDNGNGSLMRILPIVFYLKEKSIHERFKIVAEVSGITHAHIRSILACFIYIELALELLKGVEKRRAYQNMQRIVNSFLKEYKVCSDEEINKFHRILENSLPDDYQTQPLEKYLESEIFSSGYVLHTLEASIWCFLKTETYTETVLKAVNLGGDTDTTGCVTGGLAGLYYGIANIPKDWIDKISRKEDIELLAVNLFEKYL